MKELELSHLVLNSILLDGLTTKAAINKIFSTHQKDKQFISVVSILTGCELRHHIFFTKCFDEDFKNLTQEEKNLVYLALANSFFLRRLDKEACKKYIKDVLKEKYIGKISTLIDYTGQLSSLIDVDKQSSEYASIRFNTPSWLIKMWKKHYGNKITFQTLRANITQPSTYVMKNSLHDVKLGDEFKRLSDDIYGYTGKVSIHKNPLYKSNSGLGEIYPVNPVLVKLINKYLNPMSKEIALYSGDDDDIVKHLYVKSNREMGINLAIESLDSRPNLHRLIRMEKIKNINMFKGDSEVALALGISYPQDFVLVNPKSSSFGRIRKYPDYIFNFKKESLDELIAKQAEILDNMSLHVADGGTLIYFVDTMNKKETNDIVEVFLNKHPYFTLVESKQCFPFEKEGVTLFYAVFKLEEQND